MVTVSYPFSAHQIGSYVKNKLKQGINWIAYELDPFSYNVTLHPANLERRKKLEMSALKHADLIITTIEQQRHNQQHEFRLELDEKTRCLDLPLLKFDSDVTFPVNDHKTINMVYAGTFYGKYRNPYKLLELLDKLSLDKYVFHVYGTRIDARMLQTFSNVSVVEHGRVSRDESKRAMLNADILISFGNDIPNQIPSKIFDYIASRRPIIHFSPGLDDACLKLVKLYPNALLISNDDVIDQALLCRFERFCLTAQDVPVSLAELELIYSDYKADAVCDQFVTWMNHLTIDQNNESYSGDIRHI